MQVVNVTIANILGVIFNFDLTNIGLDNKNIKLSILNLSYKHFILRKR